MTPSPAPHLRHEFRPDDLPVIARLWAQLRWGTEGEEGERCIERALAGSSWLAVAEVDGAFAGYARALSDGVVATHLLEVAVLPERRRRGVGSALIRSCLEAFPHTPIYANASRDIIGLNTRLGLLPRPSYYTVCAAGPRRAKAA